jgi:hypothetical protein
MPNEHRLRIPLIALAGLSLLAGVWLGLLRLGWPLPQPRLPFPSAHGPLMASGFLGTLIGLERAVALEKRWAYGAPVFAGLSVLALLFFPPSNAAPLLAAAASLFLVGIFVELYRRLPSSFFAVMGAAAFLWFGGNFFWSLGVPFQEAVPWWTGFLVLMIAGERLELSRVLHLSRRDSVKFFLAVALFLFGLVVSLVKFAVGVKLSGAGLVAVGAWLLRYDMARHAIRQPGLPRFMAGALICGYAWLAAGGALWMIFADFFAAGPEYDAMLHAIFLGFVFSMIFAHAPIIFPSITGLPMPFQRAFYAHLILLHLSLLLRVGGDLGESLFWQQWGGMLNALAILLFLFNNARAVRLGSARSNTS